MTDSSPQPLEIYFDMTRTVQSRGHMAGAVRVESEFAAALMSQHPDEFIPIAWSSSAGHFVQLNRDAAVAALAGTAAGAEAAGTRIDKPRPPHTRRIIVVTGAGWLSNLALLHGLLALRRTLDAELQVVVHDLVHLRFPQWAPRDETFRASTAHEAILTSADRVLVYSDSTERDIASAVRERALVVNDIGRMTLGTAFVSAPAVANGLEALTDRPFVLYVSSVATRKNHQFIAEVWSRLAAERGAALPRLLFVGRAAPDQKDALERLSRNPALHDHLIQISGASDGQLAWLYEHCLFTVFPSLYEGWGLPVAESLAFGKVCLASNASSIPEAAGGVSPLLDPLDINAWCEAVKKYIDDSQALAAAERRVREGYRPITWPDAAARLWDAVTPPLPRRSLPPLVNVGGQTAGLATHAISRQARRPLRDALGLVVAFRSRQAVRLEKLPPHGIELGLTLRNDGAARARIETNVNGALLDNCEVPARSAVHRTLDVPRDALLMRGLLELITTCRSNGPEPEVTLEAISATALTAEREAAAVEARREAWRLDESLHFSAGSRHVSLLRAGWDQPAQWGVWTVEPRATLSMRPVPAPLEPFTLVAMVRGFVPPQQPVLDVDVHAGDTKVATWSFAHPGDFAFVERRVTVPPELIREGVLTLTFVVQNARSPRELGMSQDERRLGIGLVRLHAADAVQERR